MALGPEEKAALIEDVKEILAPLLVEVKEALKEVDLKALLPVAIDLITDWRDEDDTPADEE